MVFGWSTASIEPGSLAGGLQQVGNKSKVSIYTNIKYSLHIFTFSPFEPSDQVWSRLLGDVKVWVSCGFLQLIMKSL